MLILFVKIVCSCVRTYCQPVLFEGIICIAFIVCIIFHAAVFSSFCPASPEEALLEKALAVSTTPGEVAPAVPTPSMDFNTMSEDEQIAYALRLSMENSGTSNIASCHPQCNTVSEGLCSETLHGKLWYI